MGYKQGDMVWLNSSNIPSIRTSKKLDQRYLGPYEVGSGKSWEIGIQIQNSGENSKACNL